MMTLNFIFIGMGLVSIGFLIYLLVKSFKNDELQKDTKSETITRRIPEPIGRLDYIDHPKPNKTVALAAPKKPFSSKVGGYNKNVRVNNIVLEDEDTTFVDVDPIETALDVADVIETITYMGSTPSDQYPIIEVNSTPTDSGYQPSSNEYSSPAPEPVQDSWSPAPSYSDTSSYSSFDSGSSSSYSDSSSSYSSYDSGSSYSSFDSGSSSFDSSSSSSFDSGSW